MNNKGQSILAEHVMIFFVVVAALVAMTTFVQRSLEARIHDGRVFAIDSVSNLMANQCPECLNATGTTGNQIPFEYEPYYSEQISDSQSNSDDKKTERHGAAIGDIFVKSINENTQSTAVSIQLPAECADGVNPKPSYCP